MSREKSKRVMRRQGGGADLEQATLLPASSNKHSQCFTRARVTLPESLSKLHESHTRRANHRKCPNSNSPESPITQTVLQLLEREAQCDGGDTARLRWTPPTKPGLSFPSSTHRAITPHKHLSPFLLLRLLTKPIAF